MAQDLRSFLDEVKRQRADELVIVSKEVDAAYEITALVVKLEREKRRRPIIVFEHGKPSAAAYGTKPTDVYDLLVTQASLRIYDLDGVGPITRDEFSELFETGARWNFVARS